MNYSAQHNKPHLWMSTWHHSRRSFTRPSTALAGNKATVPLAGLLLVLFPSHISNLGNETLQYSHRPPKWGQWASLMRIVNVWSQTWSGRQTCMNVQLCSLCAAEVLLSSQRLWTPWMHLSTSTRAQGTRHLTTIVYQSPLSFILPLHGPYSIQ